MAKKKSQSAFNMTQEILALLTENPQLGLKEASAAVTAKYPGATINEGSFSVAFYTARKKLGISSTVRRKKSTKKAAKKFAKKKAASVPRATVDIALLQATAKFVNELGGAEAALEAIKQLQSVQMK